MESWKLWNVLPYYIRMSRVSHTTYIALLSGPQLDKTHHPPALSNPNLGSTTSTTQVYLLRYHALYSLPHDYRGVSLCASDYRQASPSDYCCPRWVLGRRNLHEWLCHRRRQPTLHIQRPGSTALYLYSRLRLPKRQLRRFHELMGHQRLHRSRMHGSIDRESLR